MTAALAPVPSIFSVRPALPSDLPYVTDSFWRDYKRSPYATGVSPTFLNGMLKLLISAEGWSLSVAYLDGIDDEDCGWLLHGAPGSCEVGWISVKEPYRRRGCSRRMLEHAGIRTPAVLSCAFSDPALTSWASRIGVKMRFRPYLPLTAIQR